MFLGEMVQIHKHIQIAKPFEAAWLEGIKTLKYMNDMLIDMIQQ